MGDNQGVRTWQLGVAVFGTLLWLLLLSIGETIQEYGWHVVHKFISGYIFGFLVAFSGFVFWEIVFGRVKRFLDPHPVFLWLSYLALVAILLSGLTTLVAEIFGNTDWRYNIGSLLGALVVGVGVLPVIDYYDRVR